MGVGGAGGGVLGCCGNTDASACRQGISTLWNADLSGGEAGQEKLESRLINRGGIWVLFREPVWGLGAGAEAHSTCPETQGQGSHYPPPAPNSMNLIPEQCEKGKKGAKGGRGRRIISLGNSELFSLTITDRQGFIFQLRSKDWGCSPYSAHFKWNKVIWKCSERTWLHRCCFKAVPSHCFFSAAQRLSASAASHCANSGPVLKVCCSSGTNRIFLKEKKKERKQETEVALTEISPERWH